MKLNVMMKKNAILNDVFRHVAEQSILLKIQCGPILGSFVKRPVSTRIVRPLLFKKSSIQNSRRTSLQYSADGCLSYCLFVLKNILKCVMTVSKVYVTFELPVFYTLKSSSFKTQG